MSGKEMTIREATVFVLDESDKELQKLKDLFKKASDLFDSGEDLEGLQLTQDEIIQQINSLFEFCISLVESFHEIFPQELSEDIEKTCSVMDSLMKTLAVETEKSNFTEIGDILRFDFTDLLVEFSALFSRVGKEIEKSKHKGLDEL